MSKKSRSLGGDNLVSPSDLSTQVTVDGEGNDEAGRRYIKLRAGTKKLPPYSLSKLIEDPSVLFRDLGDAGVRVITPRSKAAVLQQLQSQKEGVEINFEVATRPGWHGSRLVFPDRVFGRSKLALERAFDSPDAEMLAKFRSKGTLKQWQDDVFSLCQGNSRLLFSLSLAAAPLILPFVQGPRSGGFQLHGDPEKGKTTAAMAAGSFWGSYRLEPRRDDGFSETWNSTANKLELTALVHNCSLLILDETKLAGDNDASRADTVVRVVMSLSEQTEKGRHNDSGSVRSFSNLLLSTSNYSLNELCRRGGKRIDDAERGRLVDIPLPSVGHGLYEELHGFAEGKTLTNALKERSRRLFGTARLHFAEALQKQRKENKHRLKRWLGKRRKRYFERLATMLDSLNNTGTAFSPPLERASERFATVYAAGALAIRYGTFPIKRADLLTAIIRCQVDGLLNQQGSDTGPQKNATPRGRLEDYLRNNRALFIDVDQAPLDPASHKFGSVPGYLATFKGVKYFYLTSEKFAEILGKGSKAIKAKLADDGLLERSGSDRFVVQRPIFKGRPGNKGYRTVCAIMTSIIEDEV